MSDFTSTLPAVRGPASAALAAATLRRIGDGPARLLGQPAIRRALPLIAVLGVAALALIVVLWLREPPRATLMPGLADADKAAVVAALGAAGVDVAINRDTGAIEVPQDDVHRARMLLAEAGLPKAVPGGYDLLADMPLGVSRVLERARMKQAQEGELARSIESIGGIAAARVMLAVADPTPFVRDTAQPAASVFVRLQPGRALGEAQVRAIMQLVASSVPGMAIDRVAVVDGGGQLLSPDNAGGELGESSRQLAHKARMERALLARVAALLTPVLGAENYAAQVNLELDFTAAEQTSERYSPATSALRSEQGTARSESSATARGVPGALSNIAPPTPQVTATPASGAPAAGSTPATPAPPVAPNSDTSFTRNYEVGRDVSVTRPAIGQVRRLTVAVVVRDAAPIAGGSSAPSPATLQRLVATAVGLDARRGDVVSVVRQPFAAIPTPAEAPAWRAAIDDHAGHAVMFVAIIAALIAARSLLRRARPTTPPTVAQLAPSATPAELPPPARGEPSDAPALDAPPPTDPDLLDQIARARPKISNAAEILSAANTYDDKIAAIRIFVGEDAARASSVLKQLLRQPNGAAS